MICKCDFIVCGKMVEGKDCMNLLSQGLGCDVGVLERGGFIGGDGVRSDVMSSGQTTR